MCSLCNLQKAHTTSCLFPHSGLAEEQMKIQNAKKALKNPWKDNKILISAQSRRVHWCAPYVTSLCNFTFDLLEVCHWLREKRHMAYCLCASNAQTPQVHHSNLSYSTFFSSSFSNFLVSCMVDHGVDFWWMMDMTSVTSSSTRSYVRNMPHRRWKNCILFSNFLNAARVQWSWQMIGPQGLLGKGRLILL